MKIRRIGKQDVLFHAKNYNKRSYRNTYYDLFQLNNEACSNKSERDYVEFQQSKNKLFISKQTKKQNLIQTQQSAKIVALHQKIKSLYSKLSTLYNTNESKLISLLVKHIKLEYYIYSKEIMEMVRGIKINKQNTNLYNRTQSKKVIHELNKFEQFLQTFYEKKRIKQIQIIQDSIVQRQQTIRENTPFDRYKLLTKNFRPALITNSINIMDEFKQMSAQNGAFKELNRVQCTLYKKLRQTEDKLSKIFTSACHQKVKNQLLYKSQDI